MRNRTLQFSSNRGNVDAEVPPTGRAREERTLLGLNLLQAAAVPGVRYTQEEIAAWAGTSVSAIYLAELSALKKLRRMACRDKELREWVQCYGGAL